MKKWIIQPKNGNAVEREKLNPVIGILKPNTCVFPIIYSKIETKEKAVLRIDTFDSGLRSIVLKSGTGFGRSTGRLNNSKGGSCNVADRNQ
jgi:hypothetical protein